MKDLDQQLTEALGLYAKGNRKSAFKRIENLQQEILMAPESSRQKTEDFFRLMEFSSQILPVRSCVELIQEFTQAMEPQVQDQPERLLELARLLAMAVQLKTTGQMPDEKTVDLARKARELGWKAFEVSGHDAQMLNQACELCTLYVHILILRAIEQQTSLRKAAMEGLRFLQASAPYLSSGIPLYKVESASLPLAFQNLKAEINYALSH